MQAQQVASQEKQAVKNIVKKEQKTPLQLYLEGYLSKVDQILTGTNIGSKSLLSKFLFVLNQNDKLLKCDSVSIFKALVYCAEKKMTPTNGKIILTPYGTQCKATLGVQGLRELIRRNPQIVRVGGDVVRKADTFNLTSGLNPTIDHIPYLGEQSKDGDELSIIGAYAFAEMQNGKYLIRYSTQKEIETSKACNKGSHYPDSIWNKYPGEMSRLVPLRKLAKELISDEDADLDTTEQQSTAESEYKQTISEDGEVMN